jgi:hypothetical protein
MDSSLRSSLRVQTALDSLALPEGNRGKQIVLANSLRSLRPPVQSLAFGANLAQFSNRLADSSLGSIPTLIMRMHFRNTNSSLSQSL